MTDGLRAAFVLGLQRVLPGARFSLASAVLRALRMRKDADEVELLRLAAHAADRVIDAMAAGPLVGRTEADVAREVVERLVAEGHEHAEFSIVASGPNSASPHHHPGDRVIQAGEPIVFDIGGTHRRLRQRHHPDGVGDRRRPGARARRGVPAPVRRAPGRAGRGDRRRAPGRRVRADRRRRARRSSTPAATAPRFIHRTGHGIGLEVHEEPYLVAGNAEPLAPGIAFSVEPGIYLEGRYGARIEDIVVCGVSGPIVLNEGSRDLLRRQRLSGGRARPRSGEATGDPARGIIRRSGGNPRPNREPNMTDLSAPAPSPRRSCR